MPSPVPPRLTPVVATAALAVMTALSGCGGQSDEQVTAPTGGVVPPPAGATFDYQLGGGYPISIADAEVVARDATDAPAGDGHYDICYVNGFQTQPGAEAEWDPTLLLRDADGAPVIDPAWPDEILLDPGTPERIAGIVATIGPVIDGCADAGYEAVEIDNLDTWTRSDGRIDRDDTVSLATAYVDRAHDAGLAIGQKNAAEHSELFAGVGFDFAISEECAAFDECGSYLAVYDAVFDIEYERDAFTTACAARETYGGADGSAAGGEPAPPPTILRDLALGTPDDPEYVREVC